MGSRVCGEAIGCRLDGLMVCLVDSDSESNGACGEALSCRLDGLVVRLAGSPTQVRGCLFGDPLIGSVESDSESV